MQSLPGVIIAVGGAASGSPAARLVDACDLLLTDAASVEAICARIAANPIASTVLVQLLRDGTRRSLDDGLLAESLAYSTLQAGDEFARWLSGRSRKPQPTSSDAAVLVSRQAGRLDIELNRPERSNAYSTRMRDDLCAALEIAIADDTVTEIELRGRGSCFSSGGDLDEFGTAPDPAAAHMIRSARNAGRLIATLHSRVRAHVHGACVGAGVELPAFASEVVASKSAYFQLPEVAMGLVPGAGGTVSVARRIGRGRTAWMALTGARVDVATALAWGLVDRIDEAAS
jgi:enoyl-CoA hydratase/carnithine racemase